MKRVMRLFKEVKIIIGKAKYYFSAELTNAVDIRGFGAGTVMTRGSKMDSNPFIHPYKPSLNGFG